MNKAPYFVFSNDLAGRTPFNIPVEEVDFYAVANLSSLHALSHLREFTEVKNLCFFDINEDQLAYHKSAIRLAAKNTNRLRFLEELLHISIPDEFISKDSTLKSGDLDWSRVNFSEFEKAHGISPNSIDSRKGFSLNHPRGGKAHWFGLFREDNSTRDYWAGFDYGYLRRGILPFHINSDSISHVTKNALDVLNWILKQLPKLSRPVVVWLSNVPPLNMSKTPLGHTMEQLDSHPLVHLWTDARIDKYWQSLRHPQRQIRPPHHYVYETIGANITPPGIEIVANKNNHRRESAIKGCTMVYWKEFLAGSEYYPSIVLHILRAYGLELREFQFVLDQARLRCEDLFIMEHFRESYDFRQHSETFFSPGDLRKILGKENHLWWGYGKECAKRNFIMHYCSPPLQLPSRDFKLNT